MRNCHGKRAALTAALSVVAVVAATPGVARPWDWSPYYEPATHSRHPAIHSRHKAFVAKKKPARKTDQTRAVATPAIPPGPLQIIVSINSQRVTLYANGAEVTQAPVSTGTPGHPTPMGLFTVIQKERHHVSNLYDAPMPYMQRITWSGSAMHQGPLPGYPASHGCIRLPTDFAVMLWKTTKLGARVVIAREDAKPVDIEHPHLFVPRPKFEAALRPSLPVRIAAGTNVPGAVVPDSVPARDNTPPTDTAAIVPPATPVSIAAKPLRDEKSIMAEPATSARDLKRRTNPVSVFISRKDNRLYVRQAMQPLFDVPVTIRNASEPIGTHVFTAMELKSDGAAMRWNAVSIPSGYPRPPHAPRKGKVHHAAEPVTPAVEMPLPSASDALDRLELTQDIRDQIGALLSPGSSLIISDNSLASGETGSYTDFIVLTH